ncbi:hypothetical protein CL621_01095 [archaeon]|nr:hypothetical protein [archaeon]|tara:strand:- start:2046 stop:2345 length:300 start_codon:yes stop_codon:yes gene_type:complete
MNNNNFDFILSTLNAALDHISSYYANELGCEYTESFEKYVIPLLLHIINERSDNKFINIKDLDLISESIVDLDISQKEKKSVNSTIKTIKELSDVIYKD